MNSCSSGDEHRAGRFSLGRRGRKHREQLELDGAQPSSSLFILIRRANPPV